jgi:hypothetical protein
MNKKRARLEGRFAAIPAEVLESEAWRTLSHGARSALTVLAVQFSGVANGIQNLSRVTCRKYGLDHGRTHRDAVRQLEERGLVVRTFTAEYRKSRSRVPSQWALAWRDVTHRNNELLGRVEKAPADWRLWKAVSETKQCGHGDNASTGNAVATTPQDQKTGVFSTHSSVKTGVATTHLSKESRDGGQRTRRAAGVS